MGIFKYIYDEQIRQNYWLANCSASKFEKELKKYYKKYKLPQSSDLSGRFEVIKIDNIDIPIIWAKDEHYLLHELIHAVIYVFNIRDFPIKESDEQFAYYLTWIYSEAKKVLKFEIH